MLDDKFASIVRAVRLRRRIFDNMQKSMSYSLAVHVPNAILRIVTGATLCLLALALYLPFLAGIFRFAPLPFHELAAAFVLGLASLVWFQVLECSRSVRTS